MTYLANIKGAARTLSTKTSIMISKTTIFSMAIIIAMGLTMGSCRSSKTTQRDAVKIAMPECVTAKMHYHIIAGENNVMLSGNMKMKKDKVLRLQLVVLGLMEAARLELTPDHFLIVDRLHKRYAYERYDDVALVKNSGHNFKSIQRMFYEAIANGTNRVTISDKDNDFTLKMEIADPENDCDWETITTVSKRYEKVSANQILKELSDR